MKSDLDKAQLAMAESMGSLRFGYAPIPSALQMTS
jgi:hypothetical protein